MQCLPCKMAKRQGTPMPLTLLAATAQEAVLANEKVYRNRVYHKRDPRTRLTEKYIVNATTGCWEWQGPLTPTGYAKFRINNKDSYAHRAAYATWVGVIPGGDICVCHKCDNRKCVNPDHLFLGTRADNIADAVSKNKYVFGGAHYNAKLTDADLPEIRKLLFSGVTQKEIAAKFGVSKSLIGFIKAGKAWRRT